MESVGDDVLTLILLKLDLESLIRSTACSKRLFSLVNSDASFISLYKTLHGAVLGFVSYDGKGGAWGCAFGAGKVKLQHVNIPSGSKWLWMDIAFHNQCLYVYHNNNTVEAFRMNNAGWEEVPSPPTGDFLRGNKVKPYVSLEFRHAQTGRSVTQDLAGLRMLKYWFRGMKLYVAVEEVDEANGGNNDPGNGPKKYINVYDLATGAASEVQVPFPPSAGSFEMFEAEDNKLIAVSGDLLQNPHIQVWLFENGTWRKTAEVNYEFPVRGHQLMWVVGATEKCVAVEVYDERAAYNLVTQAWSKVEPKLRLFKPFLVDFLQLFEGRILAKLGVRLEDSLPHVIGV